MVLQLEQCRYLTLTKKLTALGCVRLDETALLYPETEPWASIVEALCSRQSVYSLRKTCMAVFQAPYQPQLHSKPETWFPRHCTWTMYHVGKLNRPARVPFVRPSPPAGTLQTAWGLGPFITENFQTILPELPLAMMSTAGTAA